MTTTDTKSLGETGISDNNLEYSHSSIYSVVSPYNSIPSQPEDHEKQSLWSDGQIVSGQITGRECLPYLDSDYVSHITDYHTYPVRIQSIFVPVSCQQANNWSDSSCVQLPLRSVCSDLTDGVSNKLFAPCPHRDADHCG